MAKILDRQNIANDVAMNWRDQFFDSKKGEWRFDLRQDCQEIHEKLIALGENPNPDMIDEIIGNYTWTAVICFECNRMSPKAIVLGKGKNSTSVCFDCYKKIYRQLFK